MADLTIEQFRENIRKNLTELKLYIDPTLVVPELVKNGILTSLQEQQIDGETIKFDKNCLLLELLRTRSTTDVPVILKCFRIANQHHMADIMSGQAPATTAISSSGASANQHHTSDVKSIEASTVSTGERKHPVPRDYVDAKLEINPQTQPYPAADPFEWLEKTSGKLRIRVQTLDKDTAQKLNDGCYRFNISGEKGLALIISNQSFDVLSERRGTEVDRENLCNLFFQLGYETEVKCNRTAAQIKEDIQEFGQRPEHKEADSAVVVIMSHGKQGAVYGTDGSKTGGTGGTADVDGLVKGLDSQQCLKEKPKLFFIQACRGDETDFGSTVEPEGAGLSMPKWHREKKQPFLQKDKIPTGSDVLIAYSTIPGYVSWRDKYAGSWFAQAICKVFEKHADRKNITDLLTMVNNRVAKAFEPTHGAVQMPEYRTSLRKQFYFVPIKSESESESE